MLLSEYAIKWHLVTESTVVPAVADEAAPSLILSTNGCYTKCLLEKYNYLHTVINNMTLLCTRYYENWSMSVEDIANQSSVIFEHD